LAKRRDEAGIKVLFVCIENSTRSQIAEGFARKLGMVASSAGTVPSTHVNPLVIDAMREVGVDISRSSPKELTGEMIESTSIVVLTDASLEKSLPGNLRRKMRKKIVEWNLLDPQGKSIEEIRFVRDQIERMVEALAKSSSAVPH
jgi:protein-tyrosine-phosphatase